MKKLKVVLRLEFRETDGLFMPKHLGLDSGNGQFQKSSCSLISAGAFVNVDNYALCSLRHMSISSCAAELYRSLRSFWGIML